MPQAVGTDAQTKIGRVLDKASIDQVDGKVNLSTRLLVLRIIIR
jgi:hypothetical protein